MSRATYAPKETKTGTGSLDTYTFNFKIEALTQLLVVEVNDSGVETQRVRGDDAVYLSSVTFDAVDGGGTVVLAANLANNYNLIFLLANDDPTQDYEFRNKTSFTLKRFESALDFIAGAVQRLAYRGKQALRIHDLDNEETFNSQFPPGVATSLSKVLQVNAAGTGLEFGPTATEVSNAQTYATNASNSADASAASAAAALVSENAAAASALASAQSSSKFLSYATDAAYVAANGAAEAGDVYYNTTDHEVRIYDGNLSAWIPILDGEKLEFTIADNQGAAVNVTGMLFNSASFKCYFVEYFIKRGTTIETGIFTLVHDGTNWVFDYMSKNHSNSGVTFSTTTAGQLQYTSSVLSAGTANFRVRRFLA